jgi:hypothetical protein
MQPPKYILMEANGCQLTVSHTAGDHRELRNKFITARNRKPRLSSKAFVRAVRDIKHHDDVSSGIFADLFPDMSPHEWTKKALITLEEATEAYMVEVTAEFHC